MKAHIFLRLFIILTLIISAPLSLFALAGKVVADNPKILIRAPFDGTVQNLFVKNNSTVVEEEKLLQFYDETEENTKSHLETAVLKTQADLSQLNALAREKSSIYYTQEVSNAVRNNSELKTLLESQKAEFNQLQTDKQQLQNDLDNRNRTLNSVRIGIEDRLRRAEQELARVNEAEQIALKRIEIPYGKYRVDYIRGIKDKIQLKVDSIRRDLQQVQEEMDTNTRNYNLSQEGFKQTVMSALLKKQDEIKRLKEQLQLNAARINESTIKSPVAGIVEFSSSLKPNQNVQAGNVLLTIYPVEYETVIESYVEPNQMYFAKGGKVKVNFFQPELPSFNGEITYITPEPTQVDSQKAYIMYVKIPNKDLDEYPDFTVQPGMYVDITP